MVKVVALFLLISLSCVKLYAADPPLTLYDEGIKQGVIFKVDCVGNGVACTKSGITGTITANGGGATSPAGNNQEVQYNNSGSFGSNTNFIVNSNGNVAIGTTTAGSKLTVTGAIAATGAITGSNLSGTNTGDQTTITGNAGTATALAANGTNASAGNAILGVDASGNAEGAFDVWTEAENTAAAYTPQATTITVAGTANQITSSAGAQSLAANRTWTLSFPSNVGLGTATPSGIGLSVMTGNVGIGTWSPTTSLQVVGTINATTLTQGGTAVLVNGGALGTPSSGTLTNATGLPVSGITSSTSTALGVGSIELGNASDTTIARSGAGAITVEGTSVLLSGGALGTPSSGTATNLSGASNITQAGGWTDGGTNVYTTATTDNVGIGTTTPSTTLEIVKQGSQSPLMVSATATGDGNYLIIKSDGNVGIGTVNPASTLTITGSSPEGRFVDTNTAGYSSFRFFNGNTSMGKFESAGPSSADAGLFIVANIANYPMAFATNDTNRLTIAADGNVGIGTSTSWASPFEVRSTTNNIFSVKSGANTACNTTCISACIGGFDNGTTGNAILACTDATADTCLCAGSN